MIAIDLSGQTAAITGGAQGIGGAITDQIARAGGAVAVWDLDASLAEAKAASLRSTGARANAFEVDISDPDAVTKVAEETEKALGPISICVNCAGIAGPNSPLADYPVDAWRQIMDLNLNGTFFVNRAVVPGMVDRGYGRIVNVASVAGKEGNPNASAYSASKAGVIGLTKSLGKELCGHDIAVNCITPAAARTRIFDQMSEEHIQYMLSKIPRGRFVDVDEIAAMVLWLVSKENSYTTGAVFDLSGGRATY